MKNMSNKTRGNLIIPSEVQKQIEYLHSNYHGKEWSGILVYELVSGDFNTLDNFNFSVLGIYLMNLGEGASTEFNYESALAEVYDIFGKHLMQKNDITEEAAFERINTGLIHSHHTMQAYFSGTDMSEIRDSTPKHNYYISLVVNTKNLHVAKIAFSSTVEIEEKHNILDSEGKIISFTSKSNKSGVIDFDLDVKIEETEGISEWFIDRYEVVEEEKRQAEKKKSSPFTHRTWGSDWEDRNKWKSNYYDRTPPASTPRYEIPKKSIILPEKEDEIIEDVDNEIEDFGLELITELCGRYFVTLERATGALASEAEDPKMTLKFDTVFTRLYIKTFEGKPSDREELQLVVGELIMFLDFHEPEDNKFTDKNMLNQLKDLLYEKYSK